MRITILANNDVGLYKFRKELIQELLVDNEVRICLPEGLLVSQLEEMGCEFINTPIDRRGMNPFVDIKLFLNYIKILKQGKSDLVITYTIKPNIYGGLACRLTHCTYAINITGLGTAFEGNGFLKKLVTLMYKIACKKAKVVFFENEENKQIFIDEKIIKDCQAHRLNGAGVNLKEYSVKEYPYGEKVKFLFMGRVMQEKGVNELFAAMKKLISDGISCQLDVLGGYEENYKDTIAKYEAEGWLHYYGYQKDVKPFIEECHCFVLPSWHEGMANTNLECAASGRPVITSNISGCKEAVVDGVTGYLVDKKNPDSLYNAMKKFINLTHDNKIKMGLAGRKKMEEIFDKQKVVDDTINCLLR